MQKYNESIYDKNEVELSQKISIWEKILLFFIPKTRVENEETISSYKKLFGKFYLMDFDLKSVSPKRKELE